MLHLNQDDKKALEQLPNIELTIEDMPGSIANEKAASYIDAFNALQKAVFQRIEEEKLKIVELSASTIRKMNQAKLLEEEALYVQNNPKEVVAERVKYWIDKAGR